MMDKISCDMIKQNECELNRKIWFYLCFVQTQSKLDLRFWRYKKSKHRPSVSGSRDTINQSIDLLKVVLEIDLSILVLLKTIKYKENVKTMKQDNLKS